MIMNAFLPAVQMSGDSLEWLLTGQSMPTGYSNSAITVLRSYAFCGCSIKGTAVFENVTGVGAFCFSSCEFSEISMPALPENYLKESQFYKAGASIVRVPLWRDIPTYAFYNCSKLTDVYWAMSDDTTQGFVFRSSCFQSCYKIDHFSIPKARYYWIYSYAFNNCSKLSQIVFNGPVSRCYNYAFQSCGSLHTVVFGDVTSALSIGQGAFSKCFHLLSLYILGSIVAQLANITAFTSTPISTYTTSTGGVRGSIFVPASLYSTYSTSTNWTTYSSRFVSLTDAQISAIKEQFGLT